MKNLFVSNYSAYGDQIVAKGMIDFLSLYYDKIFILVDWKFVSVIDYLYFNNSKIFSMSYDYFMTSDISNDISGECECMCLLGNIYVTLDDSCLLPSGFVKEDSAVTPIDFLKKNIFNQVYSLRNPIGSKFGFNLSKCKNLYVESGIYNMLGFPDEIKYKCFNFFRRESDEHDLLKKVNPSLEYSIICEYENNLINRKYVSYQNKIINLHNLSSNYFDVIKLIENATEIHLINNSISLLVYLLQISGRMKLVPIKLHSYARTDKLSFNFYEQYNFLNPKLNNWQFIY